MKCKYCGNQIAKGSKKCDRCGNKVGRTNNRLFLIILFLLLLAGGCVGVYYGLKNAKRHTPTKVIITVKPNDDAMGTVKGSGEYERNETVTIEAIANEGCLFVEWNDGNMDSIREFLADQDKVYVARFDSIVTMTPIEDTDSIEEDSDTNDDSEVSEIPVVPETPVIPKFTITVKTDDPDMGTVKGGGEYDSLAEIKIEAQPKNGYRFVSWNDGNKECQRKVVADHDQEYEARFEKIPETPGTPTPPKVTSIPKFLITVKSSDPNMGTVKGEGIYDSLAPVTIEAIANNGYRFVSWDDGNTQKKRTFKVTANQKYVARFVEKPTETPPSEPKEIEVDWNGVATYRGPGLGNKPDGIGGKLVFYKDYQLDLKKIDGRKLDIMAGEIIEPTKFKDGKLNIIGIGTLHRKDGTTHPIM